MNNKSIKLYCLSCNKESLPVVVISYHAAADDDEGADLVKMIICSLNNVNLSLPLTGARQSHSLHLGLREAIDGLSGEARSSVSVVRSWAE